jgi:hypothetical protein
MGRRADDRRPGTFAARQTDTARALWQHVICGRQRLNQNRKCKWCAYDRVSGQVAKREQGAPGLLPKSFHYGPPPILSSENKEGYYNLRNGCVAYYRPTDARHWSWIRELVDTQWEIFRHLRYRTAAIERYQRIRMRRWRKKADQILELRKNQLSKLHLPSGDLGHEQVVSLQNSIVTLEALIQEIAQRKPDDVDHNEDLETAARFAEKLDKWLKNATARRNNLLKILEYYRRTEIPAAHYDELKQDELKQISAPALGPAASVSGHVTTENHPETVASVTESSRNS